MKYASLVCLLLFGLNSLYSMEPNKINPKKFILNLPIDHTQSVGKRLNLSVKIPSDFHSGGPVGPVMEFIPKTDTDVEHWSEIITTHARVGSRLTATYFVDNFKKDMLKSSATQIKIVEESNQNEGSHKTATLCLVYTYKNRRELMFARYFSGPFDLVGFQYSIALSTNLTESQALAKIKEFTENNTSIIKF